MKNVMFLVLMAVMAGSVSGRLGAAEGINVITGHVAESAFIAGPISRSQLNQILNAGGRAPSAGNRQPWHFTVVQNLNLGRQILPAFQDGNVLILVSAFGDGQTNGAEILDCALAVENIYLAAQALGLGSRIYTGPVNGINEKMKEDLSLPNGYSVVALIRIGQINLGPDAVTAPSARKSLNSIVTYK